MSEIVDASQEAAAPGVQVTPVSWIVARNLELVQWIGYGRRLGIVSRGCHWWIGDWLRYGNARFGEKYARASTITGYDPQTLMNMVYVASRFESSRRRENLAWSHHAEVAALDPAQQDGWLDLAQSERLSVHSMRAELRSARRALKSAGDDAQMHPLPIPLAPRQRPQAVICCPECGHAFAAAAAANANATALAPGQRLPELQQQVL